MPAGAGGGTGAARLRCLAATGTRTGSGVAGYPATDQERMRPATMSPSRTASPHSSAAASLAGHALRCWFGLGITIAFTGCVLPTVPILSGHHRRTAAAKTSTTWQSAFMLSVTYVLGMAFTYTPPLARSRQPLALQRAGVAFQKTMDRIVAFAAMMLAMAASMFGAFTLQMPCLHSDPHRRADPTANAAARLAGVPPSWDCVVIADRYCLHVAPATGRGTCGHQPKR